LGKEQLSAVEKAIQHKFGGVIGNKRVSQIIKKAKNPNYRKTRSIIQ
jgi:hypothetical protein